MNILQINAVGQTSSTGRNCMEIADYINNNTSHNCYTAFAQGVSDEYGFQIGNKVEWKLHGLFSRISGKQGYFSILGTKKLIKYIDKIRPDVIHLNNLHGNFINLPILFKNINKRHIPVVITLHDCWFYTGKCTHYTIRKCFKWKTGCSNCPQIKEDNISWFFDQTKKLWKDKNEFLTSLDLLAVVGVSNWITSEAKLSFLKDAKIITCIYNWINLEQFSLKDTSKIRNEMNLCNKFVILGVASEWSDKKGLNSFLKIASILKNDTFILVGKIPIIALPKNIIHINATNNVEELVNYYNVADVFLQLSHEETFGKVVAEALACGTPVITNTFTANPELVNKNSGLIIKNDDEIIDSIEQIRIKGKVFFSRNCREQAMLNFDMNDRIKDYLNIYEEIVNCSFIERKKL